MTMFAADLRNAWRQLLARPLLTVTAVLVLALGLGACATAFSLLNAVHFKPLGFDAPGRLVQVYESSPSQCPGCIGQLSRPTFDDVARHAGGVDGVAAFLESDMAVEAERNAEVRRGALVSPSLFELLGLRPAVGPGFSGGGHVDGMPGVLLGHGLATARFGSAEAALGKPLRVNGVEHRVFGVMPEGVRFPELAELWVPLDRHAGRDDRSAREFNVVARLADGESLPGFAARLDRLGSSLATRHPDTFATWSLDARPFRAFFSDGTGDFFSVLLVAAGLVLLVTCANLAGLVLARSAEREAELGVRSALGAGRLRLLRQLMVEQLLLALCGGAMALLVTLAGVRLVRLAMPAEIPFYLEFSPDWRVLAFTLLLALLSSLAFGLLPALRASGVRVRDSLAGAGRASGASTSAGVRRTLVATEIGLTVVLLGIASVLLAALLGSATSRLNYRIDGVQETSLQMLGIDYMAAAARSESLARLRDELRAAGLPAAISGWQRLAADQQWPGPGRAPRGAVPISPEYFDVLGLPLRSGRTFTDADLEPGAPVVIIGESLARAVWPQQSAIGKRLPLALAPDQRIAHEVVGVVADGRRAIAGAAPPRELYLPLREVGQELSLKLRGPSGAELEPLLRDAVRRADPDLTIEPLQALTEGGSGDWQLRFFTLVLGSFAGMTLLAALVGLYGLIAGQVTLRRREFGLRMALGARPLQLSAAVLREGMTLALLGGVPGLALALLLAPRLGSRFGDGASVASWPLVLLAALFCAVALAACWLPARHAARTPPLTALRQP